MKAHYKANSFIGSLSNSPVRKYRTALIGAVILFLMSFWLAWQSVNYINNGIYVEATIIEYETKRRRVREFTTGTKVLRFPVYQYRDPNGELVTLKTNTDWEAGKVGEKLFLYITPEGEYIEDNFMILWLLPILFFVSGVGFLLLDRSVMNFWHSRKHES